MISHEFINISAWRRLEARQAAYYKGHPSPSLATDISFPVLPKSPSVFLRFLVELSRNLQSRLLTSGSEEQILKSLTGDLISGTGDCSLAEFIGSDQKT